MNRTIKIIALTIFFSLIALAAACGSGGSDMKTITEKKINDNLTATISGTDGKLKKGQQKIILSFTDGSGNPVDITAASLNFNMPAMGSMAEMNNAAQLTTTGTKGQFKGKLDIEMGGDWTAQLSYEGAESGKTTISTKAQ